MKKAIQQIMLGSILKNENQTLDILNTLKNAGYSGIELNCFMLNKTSTFVQALTKLAGMPVGKCARFNWQRLIYESGLGVVAIHFDLGTIEKNFESVIQTAQLFNTSNIIISGMYKFNYCNKNKVYDLCCRLNAAGKKLRNHNLRLLYHNHNAEFLHYYNGNTSGWKGTNSNINTLKANLKAESNLCTKAKEVGTFNPYKYIVQNTNPLFVNFELDVYWVADAGVNPLDVTETLGERMKLMHITDRGYRDKRMFTPIVKQNCIELGQGNFNIPAFIDAAKRQHVEAIILETHKNWINNNPIASAQISGDYLNKILNS